MTTFGQRLREIRNEHNLTQKDLAKMFKVSESAIGMYERDEREPSFKFTNEVADRFEVSVDYLLGRMDKPTPPRNTNRQLSAGTQAFLEIIELSDDEAIQKLQSMLVHEGKKLPVETVKEILSYARYKVNQE